MMDNDFKNPSGAGSFIKRRVSRRKFLQAAGIAGVGLAAAGCDVLFPLPAPQEAAPPAEPPTPTAGPPPTAAPGQILGVGKGINPGRVVWVYNPETAKWDGASGFWWQNDNIDQVLVQDMLMKGLRAQTGAPDAPSSWDALFRHFNQVHGRPNAGYQSGEKIAIKVNLNASGSHSYRANGSFTSPQMIYALLTDLVISAGVSPDKITVYDASRYIPDSIYIHCKTPTLEGVHYVDWSGGDGREAYQRDPQWQVHWSKELHGSPTFLPTCVTQANYLINLAALKGHNLAGASLCAKNHLGTICADLNGKPSQNPPQGANIHGTIAAHDYSTALDWTWKQAPMGSYNALVDLMGHSQLGGKTILFMIDGLYAAHDQSTDLTVDDQWQSDPFNGHWSSSLFLSQDGVAVDSVALDFLSSEPSILSHADVLPPGNTAENYLHEAAQADHPRSGTVYDPEKNGTGLVSLGVHDHWNDAAHKQYSRTVGSGEGIEMVRTG